jgi:hypothetical protein
MSCLIELHYLPCLAYFSCLSRFQTAIIERYEHYEKQTYRNRCHINTAQGWEQLVIPVTSKHSSKDGSFRKSNVTEVKIDYSQKWLNVHWRTIESAYRKAPYWEHYADELHWVMHRRHDYLYDLNFELLTLCLKWLALPVAVRETVSYEENPDVSIQDFRNAIQAKKPKVNMKYFRPVVYQQVFGKSFVENLSLIDLIFCEGPNALHLIRAAASHEQIKTR